MGRDCDRSLVRCPLQILRPILPHGKDLLEGICIATDRNCLQEKANTMLE